MKPPIGTLTLQAAAKYLMSNGVNTGPCLLFRQLRRRGILNAENVPLTEYVKRGWFCVELGNFTHPNRGREIYCRTFVTERGINKLEALFKPEKKAYIANYGCPDFLPDGTLNLPICKLGF